ncbi:MAG: phenylalanine--tRNA ligase subunit alpha [Propionibacteriaceae bacterium]|nr:phenylalanine--tRNA ligase subunit alpha [Propionibacteriaceae bacterium]
MVDLNEQIDDAVAQATKDFAAVAEQSSRDALVKARNSHLGKEAPLRLMQRTLGSLAPDERKATGAAIQAGLKEVEAQYAQVEASVEAVELAGRLARETVDVTTPVTLHPQGALHPITALINRMCDVFVAMGWQIAEGPEAEAEWLNFDALNFTPDHPARFLSDTLFLEPPDAHRILRTHTSPVQARTLLTHELPVYVVAPGKVYRADEYDATHLPVFHQIEGLAVDKGLGMADLKGTLDHLAKAMFGDEVVTRLRPHYFPFTEPSAEVDLRCFVCHGASVGDPAHPCRTCKYEGWIEWGGCGVVNPRVLQAAGIDTDVYSGFAFGMGVDRTVMFRNNASDLREFVEGDIRFSRQLRGVAR